MIISSRSRVSNLLFSNSCINWLNATLATPGLLATVRKASLCVRRAGIPIASPSSRARSSDIIGTRAVIILLPLRRRECATGPVGLPHFTVLASAGNLAAPPPDLECPVVSAAFPLPVYGERDRVRGLLKLGVQGCRTPSRFSRTSLFQTQKTR